MTPATGISETDRGRSLSIPTIFQFGTSRFLQAHVDLFASEALDAGQSVPPIVVVQTTRDPERARRVAAFGNGDGFPVRIRGLAAAGEVVDILVKVRSVTAGMAAGTHWTDLITYFVRDAAFIVSNTGDRGYEVDPADRSADLLTGTLVPHSFPAMLLALLHGRWQAGGAAVTILPCELMHQNAGELRRIVGTLAVEIGAERAFLDWISGQCLWINTLVDRIVSEPIEPIGAVAEPYALWAIERHPGLTMPFAHDDVVLVDDLEEPERLKLHILNLGHSWLAQRWLDAGSPEGCMVREALADPATRAALVHVLSTEVVPGFVLRGMGEVAASYVERTLTRFENPFLAHRLADIAVNHAAKVEKRVGAFFEWIAEGGAAATSIPDLRQLKDLLSRGRQVPA